MSFSRSAFGSNSSFYSYEELKQKDLKPGDLIEIERGSYRHWAMFASGDDEIDIHWCFHVTTLDGDFNKKDVKMASVQSVLAGIKKHTLREILCDSRSGKPSLARINNKDKEAEKKGIKPRPIDEVLYELERSKDREVPYSLKNLNCEHYVTHWKFGKSWSEQVTNVADAVIVVGGVLVIGAAILAVAKSISKMFTNNDDKGDEY